MAITPSTSTVIFDTFSLHVRLRLCGIRWRTGRENLPKPRQRQPATTARMVANATAEDEAKEEVTADRIRQGKSAAMLLRPISGQPGPGLALPA
ncbi:hypothetical protein ACNKHK_26530 [Shigella flexneri]